VPVGRLQADLVSRIAIAAWRARRAARRSAPTSVVGAGSQARLEAGVLGGYLEDAGRAAPDPRAALATGLSRDNYGPRALATLVRYRGSVLAELFRSLAALKLLQGEACSLSGTGRAIRELPAALGTERTRETALKQEVDLQHQS
jgi:hypothetical protein